MAPRKLTAKEVTSLSEGTYTDSSGLILRVLPSGTRTYSYQYRLHGRRRRISIGDAAILSLADARAAVSAAKLAVIKDEDPQALKDAMNEAQTVSAAIDNYAQYKLRKWKSAKQVKSHLRTLLKKHLKAKIMSVSPKDIRDILDGYRTRNQDGGLRLAHERLSAFFKWARKRGMIVEMPITREGLEPDERRYKSRTRVLDMDELCAVLRASNTLDFPYNNMVWFCSLTGQRKGEVGNLKWDRLSEDNRLWTQQPEDNKAKRKHSVWLVTTLKDMLDGLPRFEGPHVFTHKDGSQGSLLRDRQKKRIDSIVGFDDWVWHDLRRTVATGMASIGVKDVVISRCLNHKPTHVPQVTLGYQQHRDFGELKNAWEMWGEHVHKHYIAGTK